MTRFDWFEEGHGQKAMDLGIISPSIFYRFIQYKVFLELRDRGYSQKEAIEEVCERFKISYTTAFRAISFFRIGGSKGQK